MRSAIVAAAILAALILAASLSLGSGVAAAAHTQDSQAVYITTGPADRCQSFADDANRSLAGGDSAGARQIADSALSQDCPLVLVVP